LRLLRAAVLLPVGEQGGQVLEETQETEELIGRVAALDIGKAELTCCVRVPRPDTPGRRLQEVRTYATMTRSLLVLADRLRALGVTRVVMEATSDYGKAPFTCWRPRGLRCGWSTRGTSSTCRAGPRPTSSMRCGCARSPSGRCCGQASCRRRRSGGCGTRARYRADLVAVRTAEKQRVEKLLEDAQIKLSVVASDVFGVSGRAMLAALTAGERDPKALAQLARTRLRAKRSQLEEAFTGQFSDHHAFLLKTMLGRIDQATADIAELEAHIEAEVAPFQAAVDRLDEITGVGRVAAQVIIAEIGTDMGRFPTPGHLASWAKFAPGVKQSAGKAKGKASTGHGNPYLARVLGEAAVAAGRTDTFLGERYRRIARRRGAKRAIVAVGRSILVIVWHLLADPAARFHDLGAGFYDTRISRERARRNHVRQLEALGYKVTLEPAA
jgi:transposase